MPLQSRCRQLLYILCESSNSERWLGSQSTMYTSCVRAVFVRFYVCELCHHHRYAYTTHIHSGTYENVTEHSTRTKENTYKQQTSVRGRIVYDCQLERYSFETTSIEYQFSVCIQSVRNEKKRILWHFYLFIFIFVVDTREKNSFFGGLFLALLCAIGNYFFEFV